MQGTYSTHRIVWKADSLTFSSYHGNVDPDDLVSKLTIMQQWQFTGTPPTSGEAHFRINLWLFEGKKPFLLQILRSSRFLLCLGSSSGKPFPLLFSPSL